MNTFPFDEKELEDAQFNKKMKIDEGNKSREIVKK